MNAPHDLDRQLTAWLEDGPSSSPERPIDAALAHARAHPRRRDRLAFIRKDPMSSSQNPAASFRSLPLVAVLGLILAAAVAVAAAGGFFDRRPAVVPPPVATAAPSAAPTATPSPPAIPASAGVGTIHVDLVDFNGNQGSVDITDLSGRLVSAETGHPADGGSVADGTIAVTSVAGNPNVVVVTWTGSPCDTTHTMTISADGKTIDIERPACSGDSIAIDHAVQLTFDGPVDPATISGTVTTTGG